MLKTTFSWYIPDRGYTYRVVREERQRGGPWDSLLHEKQLRSRIVFPWIAYNEVQPKNEEEVCDTQQ